MTELEISIIHNKQLKADNDELIQINEYLRKKVEKLEKENEELKEQLQIESQSLYEQCEIVSKQVEQIEKMKRCQNCKNYFLNSERFYECKCNSFYIHCNGIDCEYWESVE